MATEGLGTTAVFGTTAFSANLLSLDGPSQTRESIDASHMGTTTNMEFIPAGLSDAGEISGEWEFDATLTPPINAAAEVITVTWADGAIWTFTGFATAYSGGAAIGERMTCSMTLKATGAIVIT
jgi:hypothetical protein